jgi:hypothetical protein
MKAKLVIEMPDNCGECDLNRYTQTGFMICAGKPSWARFDPDLNSKPDWCPLEEVPE